MNNLTGSESLSMVLGRDNKTPGEEIIAHEDAEEL